MRAAFDRDAPAITLAPLDQSRVNQFANSSAQVWPGSEAAPTLSASQRAKPLRHEGQGGHSDPTTSSRRVVGPWWRVGRPRGRR